MESVEIPPKYKYAGNNQPSKWAVFLRERWMLVTSLAIVLIIIVSIGTIVWVLSQPSQTTIRHNNTKQPTPTPTAIPSSTPTPTPTPSPTPTTTPSPSPSPAPSSMPEANSTPFTAADCTGAKQVYIANPDGTPVSNQPPGSWHTVKTYDYGQKITIYCEIGEDNQFAPEYALINDAYIATSDLSTTKP